MNPETNPENRIEPTSPANDDQTQQPEFKSVEDVFKDLDLELPDDMQKMLKNPAIAGFRLLWADIQERVHSAAKSTQKSINDAGQTLSDKAQQVLNTASSVGKSTAKATVVQTRNLIRLANGFIGAKPGQQNQLASELIKLAPVVGTFKIYADGWHAYHDGLKNDDQDMLQRGRVMCVSAWLIGGMDIGTLGASLLFRKAHAGAKFLVSALTAAKLGQISENADVFAALARQLLKSENVRRLADGFLDAVKPNVP